MEIVFFLVPLTLVLVAGAVVGYIWAVRSGQFDDCDTPPLRMLLDEDKSGVAKAGEGSHDRQ